MKKPILDCKTRWGSSCNMLGRLLQLRNFCDEMCKGVDGDKTLKLSDQQWERIDRLYNGLLPAKITSAVLQTEQLTVGDFYVAWIKCRSEIEKMGSPFTRVLLTRMKLREVNLMDNDAFRAGMYLDPRYY